MSHLLSLWEDLGSLFCFVIDLSVIPSCFFLFFSLPDSPSQVVIVGEGIWSGFRKGCDQLWEEGKEESLFSFLFLHFPKPSCSPSNLQLVFKSLGFWMWGMRMAVLSPFYRWGTEWNGVHCAHTCRGIPAHKPLGRKQVCNGLQITSSPRLALVSS